MNAFNENNSVRKPEWTTSFGRQKPKREDNIKVDAQKVKCVSAHKINPLTSNDPYRGRTAPLTSKVAFCTFIHQI